MKNIVLLAAFALLTTSVLGACEQNWITSAAGILSVGDTNNNNDPVTGDSTWATCASIQGGGSSCCLKTAVATFQGKADELVTALNTSVVIRDQFIMDRRGDVMEANDALLSILASVEVLSNKAGASLGGSLTSFLAAYKTMIENFSNDFATLKAAYVTYQLDRVNCFNNLVQAQVAIWCAACSSDLATRGLDVDTSQINYGTTFTDTLATACSSYINDAVNQSQILSLYYISGYVSTLALALEKLLNGDTIAANEKFIDFFTAIQQMESPTEDLEKVAYSVGTCTNTSCPWITESLFNGGILDQNLAVLGGADNSTSRRLQIEAPTGRLLQTFNDDPTVEAPIVVDFAENPGAIDNNSNSAVRNGVIACAVVALVALF